jgi:tetratricopeptide (TPR) repeat protein
MAATGKLTLQRRDFGIGGNEFWGMVIAEAVEIDLEILGTRPNYERWSFESREKPSAGEEVWKALEKAGAAAAAERFRELRRTQPDAYDFAAGQLALVVNRLMQRRRLEEALPLLAAAIEAYPDESGFYARSGEAHAALGRRDEAIAMYEKAHSLNPEGTEAMEMLRRLKPRPPAAVGYRWP